MDYKDQLNRCMEDLFEIFDYSWCPDYYTLTYLLRLVGYPARVVNDAWVECQEILDTIDRTL